MAKKTELSSFQRAGLAVLGVGIMVASALAWKYWQIDSMFAVIGVLSGLGMSAAAFGYGGDNSPI